MNPASKEQFVRLFYRACDGRLQPAEEDQLKQTLLEDDSALQAYASYCQTEADLCFYARARRAEQRAVSTRSPVVPALSFGTMALGGGVVATFAVLVVLWLANSAANRAIHRVQPIHVANSEDRFAPQRVIADGGGATHNETGSLEAYVARVVQVSQNVVWGEPSPPLDFLLRVRQGDKLNVAAGLVQIEFFSGAKIILHGPAIFAPTGPSAGHLESGRLTGDVADGNFRLITPTAEVIDLGTEFGVAADSTLGTDVVVFDGRVQVVSRLDATGRDRILDMTEGMTARIRSDGTAELGVETETGRWARSLPPSAVASGRHEASLIDILGGGDGSGVSLAGAVDATTGERDYGEGGRRLPLGVRRGDGKFHPVSWHPVINGVFVPPTSGRDVQIDTLGTTIQLPATNGLTWSSVWGRRWDGIVEGAGTKEDFWGNGSLEMILARLKQTKAGIIGMHANVGITIDLRAVHLLQRRAAREFRAVVTNLDNAKEFAPHDARYDHTADFRVFVDGALKFVRLGFQRKDGDAEVAVALKPEDRFLTMITTDGEGDSSYDQVMLIDPIILFAQRNPHGMDGKHSATSHRRSDEVANAKLPVEKRTVED